MSLLFRIDLRDLVFSTLTINSPYYNSFLVGPPNIFTTRNRADHTSKRKAIAHIFSTTSLGHFEEYIKTHIVAFIRRMDQFAEGKLREKGGGPDANTFDIAPWFHYVAFDIISDLAFGRSLGMLASGSDIAEARLTPDSPTIYVPAITLLSTRTKANSVIGTIPDLIPYAKYIPEPNLKKSLADGAKFNAIAVACVKQRLEGRASDRKDVLQGLINAKNEDGQSMGLPELTAEALAQLVGGSDTSSNTMCTLIFYCATTEGVWKKLRAELDGAVPADVEFPTHEMTRNLPYLDSVLKETLRFHSLLGLGLPREVPPESPGLSILGHDFPPGTVLSVPSYTIHHSKEIWGSDAGVFRPDRWLNGELTTRQKNAFTPFSVGPRACIGRNLAEMEMKMITATLARRYTMVAKQQELVYTQGFLRKPDQVLMELQRR